MSFFSLLFYTYFQRMQFGHDFELSNLVPSLCEFLESRYLQLKAGKIVPLQHAYLQQLYRFGVMANYRRANGENFEGIITGITPTRRLVMSIEGRGETFDLKELSFH